MIVSSHGRPIGVPMNYTILELCVINIPMILGGIIHMIIIKLPVLNALSGPIDGGLTWRDGKQLFGANKTWKGCVSMPVGTAIGFYILQALTMVSPSLKAHCPVDFESGEVLQTAWGIGLYMGLAYILAELPNSFIKRRIEIPPGQNVAGLKGNVFMVVDQIDSSLGCAIALVLAIPMTLFDVLTVALLGGLFHYLFAVLLFYVGLKKQRG